MTDLYSKLRPLIFLTNPEFSHGLSLLAIRSGLFSRKPQETDPVLSSRVFGLNFKSPIGLAAGYDKNAEIPENILNLGFGFTEIGTVTPRAQKGNPKPRIFRLIEDEGVINRLGFNNKGLENAKKNLQKFITKGPSEIPENQSGTPKFKPHNRPGIIGANVGANKDSEDLIADYVLGLKGLEGLADYYVINISSPNTPGLRALQSKALLEDLLERCQKVRDSASSGNGTLPPLLLKIAPDLTEEDKRDIADVAMTKKIDGLIISNTTISRPDSLMSEARGQQGGLSGAPLFPLSTATLSDFYKLTKGEVPLIGAGGVDSAEKAYKKIRAGASLVQLYSGMVYKGPNLVNVINDGLSRLLIRDGFQNVGEAVGADHL